MVSSIIRRYILIVSFHENRKLFEAERSDEKSTREHAFQAEQSNRGIRIIVCYLKSITNLFLERDQAANYPNYPIFL